MQKLDLLSRVSSLSRQAEWRHDMFKILSDYKECACLAMMLISHSFPWPS